MKISIGKVSEDAMSILGITAYPFTSVELKNKYRDMLIANHPDKFQHTGDPKIIQIAHEKTIKIKKSYDHLQYLAVDPEGISADDAINLSHQEFGIFDVTDICPDCGGGGRVKMEQFQGYGDCPHCHNGIYTPTCRACQGTGKFTNRSGRVVTCRVCNGLGLFDRPWVSHRCFYCGGSGQTQIYKTVEQMCGRCQGSGRIVIHPFNPVIRKGAVAI